jgi:ornithine carbamoyltransferase
MRHFLSLADVSQQEIEQIFTITTELKTKLLRGTREPILAGRVLAMLFEKPSLRTRASFEAGIIQLGGGALYLGADAGWQKRESNADFARVLSQYADLIVARVFKHSTLVDLADNSDVSVINGLSEESHPCQALADLYTLNEQFGGALTGKTLTYVGDANNVARSLAMCCGRLGLRFVLGAPKQYQFDQKYLDFLSKEVPKLDLTITTDPIEAVRNTNVVYTDVWTSMGQEAESEARRKVLAPYQVNQKLLAAAPASAYFMHCLPAKRGEEVTDDVLDGPRSIVVAQAANRMHAQKGLMAWLLLSQGGRDTLIYTPPKKKR